MITKSDEDWAKSLAEEVGVEIIVIDNEQDKIIVDGDPDNVKEFYELWSKVKTAGKKGGGG